MPRFSGLDPEIDRDRHKARHCRRRSWHAIGLGERDRRRDLSPVSGGIGTDFMAAVGGWT